MWLLTFNDKHINKNDFDEKIDNTVDNSLIDKKLNYNSMKTDTYIDKMGFKKDINLDIKTNISTLNFNKHKILIKKWK